jgi:hypothetical protein
VHFSTEFIFLPLDPDPDSQYGSGSTKSLNPNPQPCLKGVTFADLAAVLNFMYHGEVSVAQDSLNSFLAVAEELRVKGLTQNPTANGSAASARGGGGEKGFSGGFGGHHHHHRSSSSISSNNCGTIPITGMTSLKKSDHHHHQQQQQQHHHHVSSSGSTPSKAAARPLTKEADALGDPAAGPPSAKKLKPSPLGGFAAVAAEAFSNKEPLTEDDIEEIHPVVKLEPDGASSSGQDMDQQHQSFETKVLTTGLCFALNCIEPQSSQCGGYEIRCLSLFIRIRVRTKKKKYWIREPE